MDKKFIEQQKEQLEAQKTKLEEQLSSFATKNKEVEGDWAAKMPEMDTGKSLEEEADEVEEFGTRLALERTLETELKKVILALERIKKNKYGVCEKCDKPISQGRLKVYPQANTCSKCH
ncbi:MAG: TraR/DksA family transcriptional regulator [Parcubacteria group bacterium]|nr:TraR/DksA family transcriptional regulator [Parcubacteria group bacterium]